MTVTLQYFGQLRQLADRQSEAIDLNDARDIVSVVRAAAARYDPRFARILFDAHGALSASVLVLVNNETACRERMPVLRPGDTISLIPPIAGG